MSPATRSLVGLVAAAAVVIAACGDSADATDTASGSAPITTAPPPTAPPTTAPPPTAPPTTAPQLPQDYSDFRAQPTACGADAPPPVDEMAFAEPDDLDLDPTVPIRVRIETSCGDLIVELDPSQAPETVNSFLFLARQGYFDGSASHRILPGFVLQAGDPTATGFGGPGYVVPDEYPAADFRYTRGVLAMANAGPASTGSQFFIMLSDAGLPPQYSVFGRVVEGDDVLDLIAEIPLGDRPTGFGVETSIPLETLYLERVVEE